MHFQETKIFASFENKRIKQLFEQVWAHLPVEDKHKIEQNLVNMSDYQWLHGDGLAVFDPGFRTIQVSAQAVDRLKDSQVLHIAAWTFAHALWNRPGVFVEGNGRDIEAEMQAEAWGFPRPKSFEHAHQN